MDEKVLEEDEEMALWFYVTTAKSHAMRSISAPFGRETIEKCTCSTSIPDDEQLRRQFE